MEALEKLLESVVHRMGIIHLDWGCVVMWGVAFIALIVVMIVLHLSARVFRRLEKKAQEAPSPADPTPSPPGSTPQETPTEAVSASPGSTVPDEVAIAIALAMVPDEVAVAVALALTEAVEERGSVPLLSARGSTPIAWEQPGSAWKLLGRQQGLFRKTSLSRDITPRGE
jgi:hypothetical protein